MLKRILFCSLMGLYTTAFAEKKLPAASPATNGATGLDVESLQTEKARQHLRVLTTKSFARGLGKTLQKIFLSKYDCSIEFILSNQDLLSIIEKVESPADIVIGMTHENFGHPTIRKAFADLPELPRGIDLKTKWTDVKFWPIYYAALGIVYNKDLLKKPPTSFEELCAGKNKIILVDPRTSNLGLCSLLWIDKIYGAQSRQFWRRLKPRVLTVAKSWSVAYSLFLQGEAPMVMSYITSPAYHEEVEKKEHIQSIIFPQEGHYMQYTVAGILKNTENHPLAFRFLQEVLKESCQKKAVFGEWSYPVVPGDIELPQAFKKSFKTLQPTPPKRVNETKNHLLRMWRRGLS